MTGRASNIERPTHLATPSTTPLPLYYRYFRDRGKVIKDVKQHRMWVMLEAGSGIVSQHDYDPESSCEGWNGCRCEQRAGALIMDSIHNMYSKAVDSRLPKVKLLEATRQHTAIARATGWPC